MRFFALALATLPLPILAETYSLPSAPTAVIVYNDFAMVTREVTFDVNQGDHEVMLPDLPRWVDASSLRVQVTGAQLGGTRLRTDALPPQPDRDTPAVAAAKVRIDRAIRALRDLDDRIEDASVAAKAAEARLAFLMGLASNTKLPSTPDDLTTLGQMVETQTIAAKQTQITSQRAARQIAEARPDLEKDIKDARAALAALTPPKEPQALLALSIAAQQAGTIVVSVSYPAQATWEPTYDVALSRRDSDSLTLRRAALVYQNSGENWKDVTLTLSTLAPRGQVTPSQLYPPLLRYEDPQDRAKTQRSLSSLSADAVGAPPVMMEMASGAPQPNFDGPGVTYKLPNTVTIAQDAEGVQVGLDTLVFEARVFARAVPARDTTAYLMAQAENESREPLLAASNAQIFVDGALVGRSSFDAVPAGGDIIQAFGPLEDLRLTHVVLDRSEGDRGLISKSNAQTQDIRITLENLGTEPRDLEVLDTVPYSEQDALIIEWKAQPAADVKNVDDLRGLTQWNLSLAAQSTQTILITQTIRWPDGKVLR